MTSGSSEFFDCSGLYRLCMGVVSGTKSPQPPGSEAMKFRRIPAADSANSHLLEAAV